MMMPPADFLGGFNTADEHAIVQGAKFHEWLTVCWGRDEFVDCKGASAAGLRLALFHRECQHVPLGLFRDAVNGGSVDWGISTDQAASAVNQTERSGPPPPTAPPCRP